MQKIQCWIYFGTNTIEHSHEMKTQNLAIVHYHLPGCPALYIVYSQISENRNVDQVRVLEMARMVIERRNDCGNICERCLFTVTCCEFRTGRAESTGSACGIGRERSV